MAKSLEEKKRDARIQKQIENLGGKAKPPEPKTLRDALKREKLKAKMTQSASNFMEEYGFEKPTVEDRTLALMKGRRGVYNKNVPKELRDREKYEMKKDGGLIGGQKKLDKNKDGKISGDDFAMMEDGGEAKNKKNKSQSFNQSKGIYGIKNWKENTKNSREKLNSDRIARGDKRNPVKALARMIDDEFEVSDPSMYDEIHIDGAVYSSKNKTPEKSYKPQNPKKVGPKKMEMGGKVEEYGHGGSVKGGGMSCRGMGAAIKGGGFKIR